MGVIIVEATDRLVTIDYIEALAVALLKLGLSRRRTVDWLADTIFLWLEEGGEIVDELGHEVTFTDETIDDVHGRGKARQRSGRKSFGDLARVYDAAFKIAGRPVTPEARRTELTRMREVVRGFSQAQRRRYLRLVRDLRREHKGKQRAYYSAAVRRVRLQMAVEEAC
jgi:hypothetical protein